MDQRHHLAQQLEARATLARTMAEAQALIAEADRLRGTRRGAASTLAYPLFRN